MEGGDRYFKVNFSSSGADKLRETVKEKLKEFMDYTDDDLVEYVIVLVKDGRPKVGPDNELNVFLGDDSDTFVAWLWDHLETNLSLYVQLSEPHPGEVSKGKSATEEQAAKNNSQQNKPGSESVDTDAMSRNHQNREGRGLTRDEGELRSLRSAVVVTLKSEDERSRKAGDSKRSLSPRTTIQKKRRRPEERQPRKREILQGSAGAPRRLLQFAVRDAVATSRPSNSTSERSLKRLRSVVSTSAEDSNPEERPQRIQSAAGVRTAMSAAIKAVAEAVKDVTKVRQTSNVFDRLGRGTDDLVTSDHLEEYTEAMPGDAERGGFSISREDACLAYHLQNEYSEKYEANLSTYESDAIMASDVMSDGEDNNDVNFARQGVRVVSRSAAPVRNSHEDSLMVQYRAADRADGIICRSHEDLNQPVVSTHTMGVTPNIVNNWGPQYQEVKEVADVRSQKLMQQTDTVAIKPAVQLMKENSNPVVSLNGTAKPDTGSQEDSGKTQTTIQGISSTGPLREDADSRTIFVSNVHFAATKDSLSRHFNKFGDVLKVTILTDPASGQPKGSAYIEFMRKEAAENALSFDGTSYMSRILKIVKKSSSQPDPAPVMTWPRVTRVPPFAATRYSRAPFARGMPGVFRGRVSLKPSRSFQWKRDSQSTTTDIPGQASSGVLPSPTTRSLTYVRTESKTNASGAT